MFSKKYDHSEEIHTYQQWLHAGCFKPVVREEGAKKFIVPIPPPNVTGVLHIGHAMMLAVQDTLVRYHRMQGYETLWVPGTDHAGIATQAVVEKNLKKESGKKKEDLGREAFMKKLWEWVLHSRNTINTQFQRMGSSVDWSREQFTMSEQLSRGVRKAFKKLYDQQKIYQSQYMVNRSPGAQTVVSDMEVEYKEETTNLYYIRYFVEGKGDSIVVATIRPETMFADVALAVHPKDKRYKKMIGKNVLIPLINKPIPVIADERVLMDFGTGALKITPAHSLDDYHIAWDHNLPMDRFAIDKHNTFTALAGEFFAGKSVVEFWDNFIQQLTEIGNLEKIESYDTKIPYCERTGTRIQPLLSTQWFCNVEQASQRLLGSFERDEIAVYPERFKKTFVAWLSDLKPRCISRQLWRGHRIPVRTSGEGKQYCFDEDSVLHGASDVLSLIVFNSVADGRLSNPFSVESLIELLLESCVTPEGALVYETYADMYSIKFGSDHAIQSQVTLLRSIFDSCRTGDAQACALAGEQLVDMLDGAPNIMSKGDRYEFCFYDTEGNKLEGLTQDPDVLDTWFSSALRPFTVMGWPDQTVDMNRYYPNTLLETGYDIIFFWVIRMLIMGVEQTDQLPFTQVYLHGLVRDEQGRKMSKSLGNVVDPLKLADTYGADAVRASLLLGSTPGNDVKFSEQKVEYIWRFLNKLWNASRYVMTKHFGEEVSMSFDYHSIAQDLDDHQQALNPYDTWMLGKLHDKFAQVQKYIEKYMLGEALQEVIDMTRGDLCDWYIEISKKQSGPYSAKVLLYTLGTIYKLLHPYMPFATESLWKHMGFTGFLMQSSRPQPIVMKTKNYRINLLMDIISVRRGLKGQLQQKSHEQIQLLVQANKDILDQVAEQEGLIKDILNVDTIHYFTHGQDVGSSYITEMLMDITLGVQGDETTIDRREQLQIIEKQLGDEEQFLQRMRASIASPEFLSKAPAHVVEERKAKMQEVKHKITQLQLEIQKIKSSHA